MGVVGWMGEVEIGIVVVFVREGGFRIGMLVVFWFLLWLNSGCF